MDKRIGFIGAGQMGQALTTGFLRSGLVERDAIKASDAVASCRDHFFEVTGVETLSSNVALVQRSDVVFLAVKPQVMPDVLSEIKGVITENHLLVSIAAGVPLSHIASGLGDSGVHPRFRIIRVMPNTPCLAGHGAIAFSITDPVTQEDIETVTPLLKSVGRCFLVREGLLDAVTGLSGSGPAYAYLMIEALSDGGVRMGLPRDMATILAAQTLKGAAEMVLSSGEHPGVLKDRVTSPGGTTIAGMHVLENRAVRGALMDAVMEATRRSTELGELNSDKEGK